MSADKPIIGVTRRLPQDCADRLQDLFTLQWGSDDSDHTPDSILSLAENAAGLIVTPAEQIGGAVIDRLPESIRVISCFSVGYEHVDVEAAHRRGIVVTNTPGVLTEATADITWLLILGAARRASEGERLVRSGSWSGWRPTQLMGAQLSTRTLGIFGMGRIGRAVARRATGFGMNVVYHNRTQMADEQAEGAKYIASLDGFLRASDILTLHAPLTAETSKFLNSARIAQLPEGAIVINTGRGLLVDDSALIDALASGTVAAAGLDVYDGEPNLDPRYRDLPNTFLLPHLGSATVETRSAMGMLAIDNLEAVLNGKTPSHVVG